MTTRKYILVASSATIPGIEALVNKFWCSDLYRVDPASLAITHSSGFVPQGARIVLRRGRYRFECVNP